MKLKQISYAVTDLQFLAEPKIHSVLNKNSYVELRIKKIDIKKFHLLKYQLLSKQVELYPPNPTMTAPPSNLTEMDISNSKTTNSSSHANLPTAT